MTDIEQKALALINAEIDYDPTANDAHEYKALCRAIEQHEAFKQEVSGALVWYFGSKEGCVSDALRDFIIPAPKPDPLVEVLHEVDTGPEWDSPEDYCNKIRAALEARGLEIRDKSK